MISRLISVVLLSILLVACNSVSTKSQGESLVTAIDEYVAALRWSRFDRAAQTHLNPEKGVMDIDTEQLEYIRVTGHEIKKKSVNEAVNEAQVEVKLQYYHNEYGTLKRTRVKQAWWYSEKNRPGF